jgi:hypothetical protein
MSARPPVIEVIDEEIVALLRKKTPAERLAAAHAMWRYAHHRLTGMLQRQHPDWDCLQLRTEVQRRMLGSS